MEFYKLFYLIHRRTDWPRLYEFERRCMMPEWYAERERQTKLAIHRLGLLHLGMTCAFGNSEYFLQ